MINKQSKTGIWQKELLVQAAIDSLKKLDPRILWRNPVMFIVEIGSVITTLVSIHDFLIGREFGFSLHISCWLWATVLFANFAEALAEGRGKGHADALRRTRSEANAKRLLSNGQIETIPALLLRKNDLVAISDGEPIPSDGEIVKGVALVDESAITGESAPVVRETGGDRSAVTGGTKVISGQMIVRIVADPGETFLDHMIGMVESAKRQKTPNEKALGILLVAMTLAFLVVVGMMIPFANYLGVLLSIPVLISLLVCLIPTTIGGLLPAIGIAGMDRLLQHNVIAMSGRAIEAAGDVGVVLLDKTGTITLGNRMASEFIPDEDVREEELAEAALLASLSDETPEGRSIVSLAKERLGIKGSHIHPPEGSSFVPFSAQSRMSGIQSAAREIYKGSVDAIEKFAASKGQTISDSVRDVVDNVAAEGGTPLIVMEGAKILGVVRLKDILKQGISERVSVLRKMGISSVMITGDNTLTAAAIAAEAGLDDFFAQAKPETKLELIRKYQKQGHLVAMIGDGVNDAPALAQADVAVAMNVGTQAAREASNMLDLDSNPTKLLDIVAIGKKILITRGALTTFSVTNDVSKYFAIIPAMLMQKYPQLGILNIMHLATAKSAVLSAVIFNAIIIPILIPLALRGVQYRLTSAEALLRRNIVIYGLGGLLLPFIGIKLIDVFIVLLKLG